MRSLKVAIAADLIAAFLFGLLCWGLWGLFWFGFLWALAVPVLAAVVAWLLEQAIARIEPFPYE